MSSTEKVDLLEALDEHGAAHYFDGGEASELVDIINAGIVTAPTAEQVAERRAAGLVAQLAPGGLAGAFAQSIVQPLETVKVRLQNVGPPTYAGLFQGGMKVVSEEGLLALWKGMVPSAMRELSYSSLRFGLYKPIKVSPFSCSINPFFLETRLQEEAPSFCH